MPNTDGTLEKMEDLTSEPESDLVTVVCGDVTYFIPINKLIDNSKFFARALEAPMVEKKERKVVIKDIEDSTFKKVMKYTTEGEFHFNMETEACEALEAADRLDMEELKEVVCNRIKDNLDIENAKAVLSLAERFSAKHLFKSAFDFMQENDIKLETKDVVENPNLALAFMEECRFKLEFLKAELILKEQELDEKDDLLEYFRPTACFDDFYDSFDYDEEDWQVYDSLEEVEDEDHGGEEGDNSQEGDDGKEEEEKVLEGDGDELTEKQREEGGSEEEGDD